MGRYVLFFREGPPDPDDIRKIEDEAGVTILEHEVSRAVLVEASEEAAARLRSNLERWTIAEEVTYPSPQPPHKTIQGEDEG
jgi:hypothetical protein